MFNIYLLVYLLPVMNSLFFGIGCVLLVLGVLGLVFSIAIKMSELDGSMDEDDTILTKTYPKLVRWTIAVWIVWMMVIVPVGLLLPNSQKDVYPFVVFWAMDKGVEGVEDYNIMNPDSMLNGDGVLELIDSTLHKIDNYVDGTID